MTAKCPMPARRRFNIKSSPADAISNERVQLLCQLIQKVCSRPGQGARQSQSRLCLIVKRRAACRVFTGLSVLKTRHPIRPSTAVRSQDSSKSLKRPLFWWADRGEGDFGRGAYRCHGAACEERRSTNSLAPLSREPGWPGLKVRPRYGARIWADEAFEAARAAGGLDVV